jgi:hypothetical protein
MSSAGLGNPLAGAGAFGASEQPAVEETVVNNNYYGDDAIREASDNGDNGNGGNIGDNDGLQQADYGNDADDLDQSDFGSNDDNLDI